MFDKIKIACEYVEACKTQAVYEGALETALQRLHPDNQLMGTSITLAEAYRQLVFEVLGEELMDWIEYWQYETDYGKESRTFVINNVTYDTAGMSFLGFLEAVGDQ
jgi:hypothetical protein